MTCSNYGELAISVSRAANSALSSHHEFVIICYSLCNNVCEGIENISSLKKKCQQKVLALGIEMRLIKCKSTDLWQNFLTLLFVLDEITDFHF